MGLNDSYSQARSQIIMKSKIPTVNQAYAMILQDESQRLVAGGSYSAESIDPTALFSSKIGQKQRRNFNVECDFCHLKGHTKEECYKLMMCDYCNRKGHLRANCYKLIGYPADFKPQKRANMVGSSNNQPIPSSSVMMTQEQHLGPMQGFTSEQHNHQGQQSLGPMQIFTPEQYGQILSLLNKASLSESSSSAHMAGNVSYEPNTDEKWIVDTGGTNHMVGNEQLLFEKLLVGNAGNVQLPTGESTKVSDVALKCCAAFFPNFCIFQDLFTGRVKEIGKEEEGLDVLHSPRRNKNKTRSLVMIAHRNEVELWHKRVGHVPIQVLKKIPSIHSSSKAEISPCGICPLARQARSSFPVSNSRAENVFDLIHMDVWAPYKVPTYNGKRYFLTMVDDHFRWIWIFFLHLKSDVITVLKNFIVMVKTQFGRMVKCFRSDNSSEFFNHNCTTLFQMHGIIHQSSCPHTPQQNGVVERRHKHVLETARAIRFQGHLLRCLCGYSCVYNKQNSPHTRLPRGDKFAPRSIRSVFLGYASTPKGYRLYDIEHKTLFVSRDVIFHEDVYPFQGLPQDSSFFVDEFQRVDPYPDQPPIVLPSTISDRDDPNSSEYPAPAEFVPESTNPPLDSHSLPHIEESATGQHENNAGELRRSGRTSKPPIWLKDYVGPIQKSNSSHTAHCQYPIGNLIQYTGFSASYQAYITQLSSEVEPSSYHEAAKDVKWIEAMKAEIQALEDNKT
ncbi:PREDICTED: uncharacterized protein LOC109213460 [Nicotiana attenuata]|uniref:uncharacterized protein LOC109213460 n=1 Tax=Nicotiana attenuata TaxID=49451 RepID=UPI0009049276|nr:PREDICTED: uncharacterized protein LOC109213460 [Nicotiana attenuata]